MYVQITQFTRRLRCKHPHASAAPTGTMPVTYSSSSPGPTKRPTASPSAMWPATLPAPPSTGGWSYITRDLCHLLP